MRHTHAKQKKRWPLHDMGGYRTWQGPPPEPLPLVPVPVPVRTRPYPRVVRPEVPWSGDRGQRPFVNDVKEGPIRSAMGAMLEGGGESVPPVT
jgi:hypothetical protein